MIRYADGYRLIDWVKVINAARVVVRCLRSMKTKYNEAPRSGLAANFIGYLVAYIQASFLPNLKRIFGHCQ